MKLFLQKNAKFLSGWGLLQFLPPNFCKISMPLAALPPNPQPPAAGGFAPRSPLASGGWGLRPQTPKQPPPLRISVYAPDWTWVLLDANLLKETENEETRLF